MVPLYRGGTHIGLHWIGPGNADRLLNIAIELARAGKPLPVAVVVNQPDVIGRLKAISPSTYIVYRVRGDGNEPKPYDDAGQWWHGADWLNYWFPSNVGADAYQCENEVFDSSRVLRWRQFWLEGLAEAKRRNIKMTVGNFSVASYSEADVIALRDVFAVAAAQGCPVVDHAYLVHGIEPRKEPENVLRFKWIADRHPGIQVIVGEYGKIPGYPGLTDWLHLVQTYDTLLAQSNVLVALYTLTTPAGGWQGFDFAEALGAMAGYWKAK